MGNYHKGMIAQPVSYHPVSNTPQAQQNQWVKILDLTNAIFKFCVENTPSWDTAQTLQNFAQSLYREAEDMKKNLSKNTPIYQQPNANFTHTNSYGEPFEYHNQTQNEILNHSNNGLPSPYPSDSAPQLVYPPAQQSIYSVLQAPSPPVCGEKRKFSPPQRQNNGFSYFELKYESEPQLVVDQDSFPPPVKRKRRKPVVTNRTCKICGDTETPEWRKGPQGSHTLCNACGLNYAKKVKTERQNLERQGRRKQSIDGIIDTRNHQFCSQIQTERSKKKTEKKLGVETI